MSYQTGEWQLYARREYLRYAVYTNQTLSLFNSNAKLLQYKLILTRSPGQHVLNFIVPPIVVSVFTVVAVFEGCDSSERLSFAAPIMVTMSVMLGNLRGRLAVGIDGYPVLGQLYLGLMFSLVLTIGVSSLPDKLYAEPEKSAEKKCKLAEKNDETFAAFEILEKPEHTSRMRQLYANFVKKWALPSSLWPAQRLTFSRILMCSILVIQAGVIFSAVMQWLMHPLGDYAHFFGTNVDIDTFCK